MSSTRQFDLVDRAGVDLWVIWSRSGRTLMVNLATAWTNRYGQVSLDPMQAAELGRFLAETPDPNAAVELDDADTGDRITVAWNSSANRLAITFKPTGPRRADPPHVVLMADDVSSLGSFLNAGSPGPV